MSHRMLRLTILTNVALMTILLAAIAIAVAVGARPANAVATAAPVQPSVVAPVIQACVNNRTRVVRVTPKCAVGETRISWNSRGITGSPGPAGLAAVHQESLGSINTNLVSTFGSLAGCARGVPTSPPFVRLGIFNPPAGTSWIFNWTAGHWDYVLVNPSQSTVNFTMGVLCSGPA